jgi:hypothetical protein
MSNDNKTSMDQFSENSLNGCLFVVAVILLIVMPWVGILYVIAFAIWVAIKVANRREDRRNQTS